MFQNNANRDCQSIYWYLFFPPVFILCLIKTFNDQKQVLFFFFFITIDVVIQILSIQIPEFLLENKNTYRINLTNLLNHKYLSYVLFEMNWGLLFGSLEA